MRALLRADPGIMTSIRSLTVGAALAALTFLSYYLDPLGPLHDLELKSLDLRFQSRGTVAPNLPIVIVSIDQDSFDELNLPWPWPRDLHASLIRKLAGSQAKLIAFDVLFTEPKPDTRGDRALAAAIKAAGNVILACELTHVPSAFGPKMRMSCPTPLIREHSLGFGPVNLMTDQDGVVRSTKLAFSFQNQIYPSFSYKIYQKVVGQQSLEEERIPPIPYLINFRGPGRTYPIIPYYRILRDEIDPSVFQDKIVLVGAFASSLHGAFPTPFSASQPTAGVEIQANLVETLVTNDPISPSPPWVHAVIFFSLSFISIWVSFRLKALKAFAVISAIVSVYALATVFLFSAYQLWVPVVPSLLGIALTYGSITLHSYIREQNERIRLRTIFGKYVSPDVVEEILNDREGVGLSGKRRRITVLFSDIRGFTSISEQISPEQVVSLLSDYLGRVTDIVFKNGGTVDKFIGDAVMVIFGAPKSHGNDALRAVKTGIDIIDLAESLGSKWTEIIGRPLKIGVGINSGDAVVGSIGSEIRSDFTAIGDTVNLASRLEGLTKELKVPMLISEFTATELNNSVPLRVLRRVKVTGRDALLLVYTPEILLQGEVKSVLDTNEPQGQEHK
ncbi:MAG: adenylate/guanylate cyclase domain-containing protein [Deltaproteobacteria bacterium]|nr:adenylate/guanylate cyclase domain-containing protein [Deltaproteobacteria bacterium]